jgi:hypothetical protein
MRSWQAADRIPFMKSTTAATTHPMSIRTHLARTGYLPRPAQVIASPETRLEYRIDRMLGEGGFGQAAGTARERLSRVGPNPLQAAGRDAGLKLMEIKRLREKGHRITLLNETQFWRLAGRGAGKRKVSRAASTRGG